MTTINEATTHYLVQWLTVERHLYFDERKYKPKSEWLQEVISHFSLNTTFRWPKNENERKKKYEKVSKAVIRSAGRMSDPIQGISELVEDIAKVMGMKSVKSASKFLWMHNRDEIIIVDKNALLAFDRMRESLPKFKKELWSHGTLKCEDYYKYVERWEKGFLAVSDDIKTACIRLPEEFQEKWFMRRVYDIWLWHIGAPVSGKLLK